MIQRGDTGKLAVAQRALCRAIRSRRKVRFSYHAERRTVHPHVVFQSADGKVLLNGTEPPRKRWRTYDIGGISDLEILIDTFRPDPGFEPDSGHYYRVLCCI